MNFLEGSLAGDRVELGPHTIELPDIVRRNLAPRGGAVIVGVRPEDFVRDGGAASIPAEVQISEHLGPEVLVHLRASGLRVAKIGERGARSDDEEAGELGDAVVGRFDSSFSVPVGQSITLGIDASRVQLFDPASGESLISV